MAGHLDCGPVLSYLRRTFEGAFDLIAAQRRRLRVSAYAKIPVRGEQV